MQAKVVTHRTREPICRLSCRFADGKNTPLPSPIPFMAEFRYRGSALRIHDLKYTTFLSPGGLAPFFFSLHSFLQLSPILGRFDRAAYFHRYVSTMNFIPLGEGLFFSICRGYLDTLISFFLVLFAFILLFLLWDIDVGRYYTLIYVFFFNLLDSRTVR